MAVDFVIRDALDGERARVLEITLDAYQEYGAVLPSEHWQRYREDIRRTLADGTQADQIVAVRNGAVVGAVLFYPAGAVLSVRSDKAVTLPWPELRLLAVPPDQRGQGIGAALVRECIERARRSGAKILALHTTDIDEDSHAYVTTVELGIRDGPQARTAWLDSTQGWLLLSC